MYQIEKQATDSLSDYQESILELIKLKLSDSFSIDNLSETLNDKYRNIHLINFYLIYKSIHESSDIQILTPDKYYTSDFLSKLVLSITLIKYQSIQNERVPVKSVQVGDVFFVSNRLCKITRIIDNSICHLEPVIEKKADKQNPFLIKKELQRLDERKRLRNIKEFQYKSTSNKNLKGYADFFERHIKDFSYLASFSRKTVIIASGKISKQEQKAFLPIKNERGNLDHLPINPLVEVFNTYSSARTYLKNNRGKIDEVIAIGHRQYKSFGNMLNDKNDGLFSKLVLIGSRKVKDEGLKYWQWTHKEIKSSLSGDIWNGNLNSKLIDNSDFISFKKSLDDFKLKVVSLGVDEKEIELINRYFITLFSQQLTYDTEKTEEYINDLFNEDNDFDDAIYNLQERQAIKTEYIGIITDFNSNFKSAKLKKLKSLQLDKKPYVITPRKTLYEGLKNEIEGGVNKKTKVYKNNDIGRLLTNNENETSPNKTIFVIPHIRFHYDYPLRYFHLYNRMREFGDVRLLCYKGIGENRIEMFRTLYEKMEQYKLKHPDRNWFVGIEYNDNQLLEKEDEDIISVLDTDSVEDIETENALQRIKDYIKVHFNIIETLKKPKIEREKKADKASSIERHSKIKYNIIFKKGYGSYGDKLPFQETTRKFILKDVADLKCGDKVIADWDIKLKQVMDILNSHEDFKDEINDVKNASRLWKEWLKGLFQQYRSKGFFHERAIKELHEKLNLNVSLKTMEGWIEKDKAPLFPQKNEDLQRIIDLKRARLQDEDKEAFDLESKKLKKGSVSLIYKIKDELNYQICDGEESDLLSKLNENDLKKLLSKKVVKQIQSIKKL